MANSNLSIGIVGLPNVGKSTLFNALLKRQAALAANYPFATVEPNMGVVDVPDQRLDRISEIIKKEYASKAGGREVPEKVIPAVIKFYDIAGLVRGAHKGEGLGNKFLSHIREVDAIVHVVRAFEDENVIRADSVDPVSDIETINTELALADLQTLENRLQKMSTDMKRDKSPETKKKFELYSKIQSGLGGGMFIDDLDLKDDEHELLKELNLITTKHVIYAINVSEEDYIEANESSMSNIIEQICKLHKQSVSDFSSHIIRVSAKIESELNSLDSTDREEYMEEIGIHASGLDRIIKRSYDILQLETYFTAGPKEVRAWTIQKGTLAPQAAGKIHSDFERGFISAEVMAFNDYSQFGGKKEVKEAGKLRIEGKDYIVQDGDIVEFRFSV